MSISRKDLQHAKRVLVKVGSSVVVHSDGTVALGRLGNLVDQLTALLRDGKEVILVSSGMGAARLQKQAMMSPKFRDQSNGNGNGNGNGKLGQPNNRACAAAGQASLMALYEFMFAQKHVQCSQLLVTNEDFQVEERRENLRDTIADLLSLGVLPILNENDVISTGKLPCRDSNGKVLWDNDSLSMLVSIELGVELMILLSDVEGLYDSPPSKNRSANIIHTYYPSMKLAFEVGEKSSVGRGGMQAKVDAALTALNHGVSAVVIASGFRLNVITDIIAGQTIGTLFVQQPKDENTIANGISINYEQIAQCARQASRELQALNTKERTAIVHAIADALLEHKSEILEANQKDMELARKNNLAGPLVMRLQLSESKLKTLADGIHQIAEQDEPIGKIVARTELSEGLYLTKTTVPIGVLLIIFESRPDALPQIVSLAVKSGNALLLKGGKEAMYSNQTLHRVIVNAINKASNGRVSSYLVNLLESRQAIDDLLKLDSSAIDLIIPRGSSELVKYIQSNTKIPVLGHSEGICHVYIDKSANVEEKAIPIVVDAKTDYPAACNAVETILLHSGLARQDMEKIINALKNAGVQVFGGPRAASIFELQPAKSFRTEYSDKAVTLELVDSETEAIAHINKYSSSHTDSIITEDEKVAQRFLDEVDSACVFHNASTRFADGYRFGLGAEVGISTSRIHARGPVGIEGLLTTKWVLRGQDGVQIASDYSKGLKKFTHTALPTTL